MFAKIKELFANWQERRKFKRLNVSQIPIPTFEYENDSDWPSMYPTNGRIKDVEIYARVSEVENKTSNSPAKFRLSHV